MLVLNLNSKQILDIEFEKVSTLQEITKAMLQTVYAYPDDYPVAEMPFASKTLKAWHVGYKETGKKVFMLAKGTLITEEVKRIREDTPIIWRLRVDIA